MKENNKRTINLPVHDYDWKEEENKVVGTGAIIGYIDSDGRPKGIIPPPYDFLYSMEDMGTDRKKHLKDLYEKYKEDALKFVEESEMQGEKENADDFRKYIKLADYYIAEFEASLKYEEIIEMLKKC